MLVVIERYIFFYFESLLVLSELNYLYILKYIVNVICPMFSIKQFNIM